MKKQRNSTKKIVPASFGKFKVEVKEIRNLRRVLGRWVHVNGDEKRFVAPAQQRPGTARNQMMTQDNDFGLPRLVPRSELDKKNCA